MAWSILTPGVCAHWDGESLSFSPGVPRSAAPGEDVRVGQALGYQLEKMLGMDPETLARAGEGSAQLAIVDGAPGLEKALVSLWNDLAIQSCTVHKLRNLVAHAPKKLAEAYVAHEKRR